MTDFNMPPGVSVNDIPGNRPEDMEQEAFWAALDSKFEKDNPSLAALITRIFVEDSNFESESDQLAHALVEYVDLARDLAYEKGYKDGTDEARMAEDWRAEEAQYNAWEMMD